MLTIPMNYTSFGGTYLIQTGITVREAIDGWKNAAPAQRRIDQIWCRPVQRVLRSRVLWNGREEPVVSDHAGILVETE